MEQVYFPEQLAQLRFLAQLLFFAGNQNQIETKWKLFEKIAEKELKNEDS